ncbi:phospholipase D family protein [Thaumasiovibrio sp. DFM-14]|uniref:phospholipase D family protein n=1 Tax=Thaumasiovibrio sp. DFM-14 TaxID=3384792 RepID=UPI0039A286D2
MSISREEPSYLASSMARLRGKHPEDKSASLVLADPIDALVARIALMRKAQHSLDVQYYIFKNDLSGQLLANEMLLAADRGVKVRLLVDDLGSFGNDKALYALNAHTNIDIRLFNAFSRSRAMISQLVKVNSYKTRRMHNKALIADNQLSIIGGRNIGNEYFGANDDVIFADLDVMVSQPATQQISNVFDDFWNSPIARDVVDKFQFEFDQEKLTAQRNALSQHLEEQSNSEYARAVGESNLVHANGIFQLDFTWSNVLVSADKAKKITAPRDEFDLMMAPQLESLFSSLQSDLILVSPYFVPGDKGVAYFKSLRERGINITIITNSLASNDVPIVHSGYAKYRKALLKMGVRLFEIDGRDVKKRQYNSFSDRFASKSSLHAKFFILDNKATFIGSFNFDPRSVFENTEIGVTLLSEPLSQNIANEINTTLYQVAFELTLDERDKIVWTLGDESYNVEPGTSWLKRSANVLMGLLPVESQL